MVLMGYLKKFYIQPDSESTVVFLVYFVYSELAALIHDPLIEGNFYCFDDIFDEIDVLVLFFIILIFGYFFNTLSALQSNF